MLIKVKECGLKRSHPSLVFFLFLLGVRGEPGEDGQSGERGIKGERGVAGEPGYDGLPGHAGEVGRPGRNGRNGHGHSELITIHSQSSDVPSCPSNSLLLWDGYSYEGGSLSSSSSSSCLPQFGFLRSSDSSYSRWKAASTDDKEEVHGDEGTAKQMVSRCSVCEVEGSVLTRHSLTTVLPECPDGWESMWTGFSYHNLNVS